MGLLMDAKPTFIKIGEGWFINVPNTVSQDNISNIEVYKKDGTSKKVALQVCVEKRKYSSIWSFRTFEQMRVIDPFFGSDIGDQDYSFSPFGEIEYSEED